MTTPADTAIAYARAQIGKPYLWGATGPNAFDCSGLVQSAYKAAGIGLPRTSEQMMLVGSPVGRNSLEPGDLVFPDAGHVQIFVGGNTIVEAPRAGLTVRQVPIWGFLTARRVSAPGTSIYDIKTNPAKVIASTGYQGLIGNPLNAIQTGIDSAVQNAIMQIPGVGALSVLGSVADKLSNVALWKRIGMGALGVSMAFGGIVLLARKPIVRAGEAVATDGASEVARKEINVSDSNG